MKKVNILDKILDTDFFTAVEDESYNIVYNYIKIGVNVNQTDPFTTYTPLFYAILNDNYKISKLLINNGADVNAKTDYKNTPLHFAISNNNIKTIILLLKKGAKQNILSINNQYPIDNANPQYRNTIAKILKRYE